MGHRGAAASACRPALSFFEHAVSVARAAAAGGALAGSDEGVCVAALRLMNGALAWDFQFAGHARTVAGSAWRGGGRQRPAAATASARTR